MTNLYISVSAKFNLVSYSGKYKKKVNIRLKKFALMMTPNSSKEAKLKELKLSAKFNLHSCIISNVTSNLTRKMIIRNLKCRIRNFRQISHGRSMICVKLLLREISRIFWRFQQCQKYPGIALFSDWYFRKYASHRSWIERVKFVGSFWNDISLSLMRNMVSLNCHRTKVSYSRKYSAEEIGFHDDSKQF